MENWTKTKSRPLENAEMSDIEDINYDPDTI